MCPLHLQILLPMASLWPVIFLGGTADALRWAHCISRCCSQLLHLGPSDFWEALPMHSDGPIALADAAADCINWAHQISGRHCQCTQMGPLHQRMLLPITLLWPVIFLGCTSDALRWAHCISGCCYQLLHLGPLYFWEALPMHSDGLFVKAAAATDIFALALHIAVRICRCTQMGLLHRRMLLLITLIGPIRFLGGTADAFRWAH